MKASCLDGSPLRSWLIVVVIDLWYFMNKFFSMWWYVNSLWCILCFRYGNTKKQSDKLIKMNGKCQIIAPCFIHITSLVQSGVYKTYIYIYNHIMVWNAMNKIVLEINSLVYIRHWNELRRVLLSMLKK